MDFDFGYNGNETTETGNANEVNDNQNQYTNIDTGSVEHNPNGEAVEDIPPSEAEESEVNNVETDFEKLEEGTIIEVGDKKYKVDEKGNVLDEKGNLFKEAKDVKEWVDSFEDVTDTPDEITINSIQDAIGIDIHDENNNKIEFENSVEGIKSYINAVIETNRNENYETAINTLYQRYPIVEDFLNYYIANGNSFKGFGEAPDRSNVKIDSTNVAQQEYIIRTAWQEQGRKGDLDGYIQYLKSAGTLAAVAEEELEGLKETDRAYKEQIAKEAEARETAKMQALESYWNNVASVIKSKNIAGYQIPDNIIIERNGQKVSVTPKDFFNYLYRVDSEGKSAYERDLDAESEESRMQDDILRAYLKFTGGSYSNLVDMAINKKNVATMKLKAKERNTNTVRVKKPTSKAKGINIDLGYN